MSIGRKIMTRIMHTCPQYALSEYKVNDTFANSEKNSKELVAKLATIVDNFKQDYSKYVFELQNFLKNTDNKTALNRQARSDGFPSFDTVWDGAKAVLTTLDQETNPKIKQADLQLLAEDLDTMLNCLLSPTHPTI